MPWAPLYSAGVLGADGWQPAGYPRPLPALSAHVGGADTRMPFHIPLLLRAFLPASTDGGQSAGRRRPAPAVSADLRSAGDGALPEAHRLHHHHTVRSEGLDAAQFQVLRVAPAGRPYAHCTQLSLAYLEGDCVLCVLARVTLCIQWSSLQMWGYPLDQSALYEGACAGGFQRSK